MDVVKLPPGERPPIDADSITVVRTADGKHHLNCSALVQCDADAEAESIALIGGAPYDSYEEAEAAGLAWAAERCAGTVYVSTAD